MLHWHSILFGVCWRKEVSEFGNCFCFVEESEDFKFKEVPIKEVSRTLDEFVVGWKLGKNEEGISLKN